MSTVIGARVYDTEAEAQVDLEKMTGRTDTGQVLPLCGYDRGDDHRPVEGYWEQPMTCWAPAVCERGGYYIQVSPAANLPTGGWAAEVVVREDGNVGPVTCDLP